MGRVKSNKSNNSANFAWVQHFIHHLAPTGMAGFVLVRFWFWVKSTAARVLKVLGNPTHSLRERRRETLDALQAGRDPRQQIGAVINTAIGFCTLLKDIQLVAVICGA